MLYQLNAPEWRVLRRLHLAGGSATWKQIRPMRRKQLETHLAAVLTTLGLVLGEGENWRITDRGQEAQELGEVEVRVEELREIPKRWVESIPSGSKKKKGGQK